MRKTTIGLFLLATLFGARAAHAYTCGLCISGGTRCGKQSGHRHRPGDERHVSALDPSFVPWGPDWEPNTTKPTTEDAT